LFAGPKHEIVVVAPKASSCMFVFPITIAPASRSPATAFASVSAGALERYAREQPLVTVPVTS
jgi:hypothetical protein